MISLIGDELAFMDFRLHDSVWDRVPESKRAFYRAAEATICAANDVTTPAPDGATEGARIHWERGWADRLIASVESACAFWRMSEGAYVAAVERISDWFRCLGWTSLRSGLAETLAYADRAHDAGESLRRTAIAFLKGAGGSARDGASQTRRTQR